MIRIICISLLLLASIGDVAVAQGSSANIQCLTGGSPPWSNCSTTFPFPVQVITGGAAPGAGSQPYNYTAVAGAQYNLAITTSTALTAPPTALQAQVCASGNSVKYTYDGTTPTSSVGLPLAAGQCIQFSGPTLLAALRFIQTAATATLDVGYTR